jgi:RNA polymerase sigma factor for flagellar operon FliA
VHIEVDDLIHAGTMGLFAAATNYRADKEVSFPTYAKHRIRGAILDYLRQIDWASRDLRRRYRQVEKVTQDLKAKLDREPTDAEISQAIGLTRKQWSSLQVDLRSLSAASLPARHNGDEDRSLPDPPSSPSEAPDRILQRKQMRSHIQDAVQQLPSRQREVMQLYYEGDYTMREIGGMLGVNESRVSQIHRAALQRMQASLQEKGIRSTTAFCAA